jgi:glycosyltransferase involved in cell wall biosynthesis
MKVSVCITTYNHEKYIAQAIDSILMQKTNFDYEIIIGEDDSQDRTRDIVISYKEKYPNKIKLFLNSRENVIYIDGKPTGRWNFVNNLKNAEGEYIALLEGDDFWTDPLKIQKQVTFLDANPEFVMCFHNVLVKYEDNRVEPWPHIPERNGSYTLEDLLGGNFIPTGSVLLRNGLVKEFPAWFLKTPLGDWPLFVIAAKSGKIRYINEISGVYRVHRNGVWSSRSRLDILRSTIKTADCIELILTQPQRRRLETSVLAWFLEAITILKHKNNHLEASECIKALISRYGWVRLVKKWTIPYLFYLVSAGYFPQIYTIKRRLLDYRSSRQSISD